MSKGNTIRLNAFLSRSGVCSRRAADVLISDGHVCVNGQVVTEMGAKIDSSTDEVTSHGKQVRLQEKITLMLHKPVGVVSSCVSQKGETTVIDLVKTSDRLYPVGRLDKDSSGLLLLTNDGDLALQLTHPRFEHEKEYIVTVRDLITDDSIKSLKRGIMIDGKRRTPHEVVRLSSRRLQIVLREGRKRHVRRLLDRVGNRVVGLKRVRIGSLSLGDLASGASRTLTSSEIQQLLH